MLKPLVVALLCTLSSGVAAQVPASGLIPADTDIPLTLDEDVDSKTMRVGGEFGVTVSRDVVTPSGAVIPRGTRGRGEVTWRTGKGAFGKSGKMEIALRSLDIGGRSVGLTGHYREEGAGKTGVTVATIAIGGLLAGAMVHGKNAVFEQGRELHARTAEAFALDAPPVMVRTFVQPSAAAPWSMVTAYRPVAPAPILYASTGETPDAIFARRLAAAQPIRRGDPRQGWTISD